MLSVISEDFNTVTDRQSQDKNGEFKRAEGVMVASGMAGGEVGCGESQEGGQETVPEREVDG